MKDYKSSKTHEEGSILIRNIVDRLPMGCACFQPLFDEHKHITNFQIIHVNQGFEGIIGLDRSMLVHRTVADVFGTMSMQTVSGLVKQINQVYHSDKKTCEIKARVFEHIYKVSFLFISETRLLIVFEDIHAKYFRKHYNHSIPREVIQTSFAKASPFVSNGNHTQGSMNKETDPGSDRILMNNFQPLELISETEGKHRRI